MSWPRRDGTGLVLTGDATGGVPLQARLQARLQAHLTRPVPRGRIVHASPPIHAYLERTWKDRGGRERLFIYPSGANDLKDLARLLRHNALSGLPPCQKSAKIAERDPLQQGKRPATAGKETS